MKLNKLFFRQVCLICILTFTTMSAIAQSTVTGVVSDEDSKPVPGVNVIIKGTTNGVSTDFDGAYSVNNVSSTDILVFSYLGYKTVEVLAGNQTKINVSLKTDTELLDDVVIIGYGSSSKKDLTASVTSVSSKDFEKQPLARAEDALLGRTAGVQIIKNTGAPGAGIKIRVRGFNSISGSNDPLVVIDGIIGGNLANLNPNDIKTFDVLKDASATAIYGSRGANGVILVSTKQGQVGPAKIDVNYFSSISTIPKTIDIITPQQFADQVNEGIPNVADQISVSGNGVDYQDIYFQSAISNNLQLSASGKAGGISYFISGNYADQEGLIFNSDYNRFSIRANLKAELTEKLSVGLNIFGSRASGFNLIGGRTSTDWRGGVASILGWDPTVPLRDSDGNFTLSSIYGILITNPYAVRADRYGESKNNGFNTNLNLSYDITDKLNFTVLAGTILSNSANEVYQLTPAGTNELALPNASFSSNNSESYQISSILTWSKEFEKSSLKLTGVYEIQSGESRSRGFGAGQYSIDGIRDGFNFVELANTQSVNANLSPSSLESYLGRAQYDFDDRLYITGALRVDQTSRFRKGNRTGVFPSGSIAYKLNPNNGTKIRLGYGETGNQNIAPFSTFQQFATNQNSPVNGNTLTPGIVLGQSVDQNLTWETTTQINAGVDFTLLNGRISTSIDLFQKNTRDLLLNLDQPLAIGGGKILRNVGEIKNSGFDLSIRSAIIDKGDFKWDANFNLSYVENEVLDIGELENIPQSFNAGGSDFNAFRIEVGQPIGNFYGPTFLGTWKTGEDPDQAPGSAKYALDADGEISNSVIGNGIPTTTWGLNQTFTYKNLDLNILFRGVHDFDVINATRARISLNGTPTSLEYLNRWRPENQTEIPSSGSNLINSTRYVEDGSFIRLSNITLGYNLPENNVFNSLRFYVSAQNLFTITDYTGYDPEVSAPAVGSGNTGNTDTRPSIDFGAYPNPRTITLGVNIGF